MGGDLGFPFGFIECGGFGDSGGYYGASAEFGRPRGDFDFFGFAGVCVCARRAGRGDGGEGRGARVLLSRERDRETGAARRVCEVASGAGYFRHADTSRGSEPGLYFDGADAFIPRGDDAAARGEDGAAVGRGAGHSF